MRIHKEGIRIIWVNALLWIAVAVLFFVFCSNMTVNIIVAVISLGFAIFMLRFFRVPHRDSVRGENLVIAPGDGHVVDIREVEEDEFFHSKCIRISIFLSVFDVHVTWSPVSGKVTYYNYHPGRYLIAFHPKASEKNERTSIGVMTDDGHMLMFRQIAGILARRIVCYAREGERVEQTAQAGFIKFGSRIDLFLPLDTEVLVKKGDEVFGQETVLAHFNPNN
ncbi:MAG: phosphatidylserine decarboxylase family protein [Bacteroidales bacterium]|nr:phosphatidylserine decarboxylase family protein [Bacteroidales bacterium]